MMKLARCLDLQVFQSGINDHNGYNEHHEPQSQLFLWLNHQVQEKIYVVYE